jgi:hypothetical protein
MRLLSLLWAAGSLAAAANPPSPLVQSGLLDGITESAKASDEILDGGSCIGLIPIGSPTAQKILTQYFQGFFRDEAAKFPNKIPPSAEKSIARLNEIKGAGASHVIALYHDNGGETDFVRLTAIGNFTPAMLGRLEAAGLGRRGPEGSFDMLAFKDTAEVPLTSTLPPLPIARIAQMANQLAKDNDCAIDIVALKRKDANESYNEALLEAFTEEGQAPGTGAAPPKAKQISALFPQLIKMGASHVIVIAFQNPKGADIVVVLAKGTFSPESQARAKAELGARNSTESTITLARFVDGEERGAGEPGVPSEKKLEKHLKK